MANMVNRCRELLNNALRNVENSKEIAAQIMYRQFWQETQIVLDIKNIIERIEETLSETNSRNIEYQKLKIQVILQCALTQFEERKINLGSSMNG